MYNSRIYIPKSSRDVYLERCHEGHQGITKCHRRAQRHLWWPGLSSEIAEYVTKCNVCIKQGGIKHQPMVEGQLPSCPWEVIGSDVFTFKSKLYLVMIDYYSRWIEAIPISTQTSGSVIIAMRNVFACFGVPKVVRSDNGPCFDSKELRKFGESSGFTIITSSPRYPQSNGMAECAVKTVKKLWCKNDDKLLALSVYRTTPLSTGYSPSELMFGRSVRSSLGMSYAGKVDYEDFEDKECLRQEVIKSKWDKKYRVTRLPELQAGDRVWVKSPSDLGAEGFIVRKDALPDSYWVRVGNS